MSSSLGHAERWSLLLVTGASLSVIANTFKGDGAPLVASLAFSTLAFSMTYAFVRWSGPSFVKAGLRGRDMSKLAPKEIPEAMGAVAASVYILALMAFIPFAFYKDIVAATSGGGNRDVVLEVTEVETGRFLHRFPHSKLSSYQSALNTLQATTILGMADDILDLRWRHKFFIPAIASLPLLIVYYVDFGVTSVVVPNFLVPYMPGRARLIDLSFLYYLYMSALSIFAPNSINILAGINGIEVGQSLVIAGLLILNSSLYLVPFPGNPVLSNGYATHPHPATDSHLLTLYVLLPFLAVSIALFIHNKYPARVFVGDTYCYVAGMTFAVVAIMAHFSKTLLLLLIPQIVNFVYSTPQLFKLIPCPRHRLPKFNARTGLLEPSVTPWPREKPPTKLQTTMFLMLEKLRLIQESYFTYSDNEESVIDHDVHFRPGIGADGHETFTPRTVIYDLKGGFGTLRKFNALYELQDEAPTGLWEGMTTTHRQPTIQPSEYQRKLDLGLPTSQLHDADVRYWSDFNRVYYNPKSIVQLNEYELNSQIMPFEDWVAGEDLFRNLDRDFDLLDRDIRPFVEECDHMQGFQILTGANDAWGGFAAKYLDALRDEFGKMSIWCWGIEDSTRVVRQKQLQRACNSARSLRAIGQLASVYVRLAAPPSSLPGYVNFPSASDWMTTALLCAGFESVTIPTRLRADARKRGSLSLLEDTLNTSDSQNLFELQAKFNNHAMNGSNGGESNGRIHADENAPHDWHPEPTHFDLEYLPRLQNSIVSDRNHVFAQVECERGRAEHDSFSLSLDPEDRLRRRQNEESVVEIFQTGLRFPLLETFPNSLFETNRDHENGLDISAALSCNSRMKDHVLELRNTTSRLMPLEEREAVYSDLSQLAQHYSFGWDEGSDTGEDD
ncbi:tunicamycin resistance protein [Knufia peltigerae]|uniref:UDP-N-acetylglucosamine--dolichyl-phosphate N-acetylglucosaminephosphotransferase n=1 Tax=Knufia peltigerae TaxID=1002370 RepID=A0AA38XED3_9EURO|nr:tunicamycin resistance protein [Knufia peltigerae]